MSVCDGGGGVARRAKHFFEVKIKDFGKVGNRAGHRQVGNYFGPEKKTIGVGSNFDTIY